MAGWLRVDPEHRAAYLAECSSIIGTARDAPGCVDFSVCADPIEDDRVIVLEIWESSEAAASFRGTGPSDDQQHEILDAHVVEYTIADATTLT